MDWRESLHSGFAALNLECGEQAFSNLYRYIELLHKWNRIFNLTAIRDPQEIVSRHILDCACVYPYVHGNRVIDVGSGAGLPGIVLALLIPGSVFYLLDSNRKKTRFIQQAVIELQLTNVKVVCDRIEEFQDKHLFDTVLSRAYSNLRQFLTSSAHLCATNGKLLAMKGKFAEDEFNDIPNSFEIKGLHKLVVPGLQAQRCLIEVIPKSN